MYEFMEKIPIFKLSFDSDYREKFFQGCQQIFDEGFLTNHTMVRKAEALFQKLNQSPYTLAVSNGTAALTIALKAINVRNKEVILPTNTFIATYLAIKQAGGIPVISDIEQDYFALDPLKLEEKISDRTKAIILVHIGGHISPVAKQIKDLCKARKLFLIEDAAHAHFAELEGTRAGNIGDIGCFSFHMTKVVTSGEGGMLTTADEHLYQRMVSLRQFGMDLNETHSHVMEGFNFKLSEFNALAMALDLERSSQRIGKRRELAERYRKNLEGTSWKVIQDSDQTKGSFYKQIIIPPAGVSRETIRKELSAQNIALTNGVYNIPLHQQPICKETIGDEKFPVCDEFSRTHICPPCYPELTVEEIDRICATLIEIGKK